MSTPSGPNTIIDPGALLRLLDETRKRGWAKSNEEFVKGVETCFIAMTEVVDAASFEAVIDERTRAVSMSRSP